MRFVQFQLLAYPHIPEGSSSWVDVDQTMFDPQVIAGQYHSLLERLSEARDVPGARAVWFVDEGHMAPQERPDLVAREIRFFLDGLTQPR